MPKKIFISAGEASGEHYGALLIAELTRKLESSGQRAEFYGMGGERMKAAGLRCVVRVEEMAVMGLTEVVRHLPRIWREFQRLKKAVRKNPPDVAVLIDFPEIHFRLAEEFHSLGVPVIFFVSPQLWAWKKKRIKLVQKYIDRMLVIFPFEEPFYRQRGVEAEFVGHPLAELPQPAITREAFAAANGLDPTKQWVGLLPGSRPKEIRDHLPEILQAAKLLIGGSGGLAEATAGPSTPLRFAQDDSAVDGACSPTYEFVIPLAPTLNQTQRAEARSLVELHGAGLQVRLVTDARAVLFHARASIVASGTATVEAALIGNPFVVVYRVSPLTYAIAKRLVKVDHVAMVNLIAEKRVVPELIQSEFTAAKIAAELKLLLADTPQRAAMITELAQIHGRLDLRGSGGAIARVAAVTLQTIGLAG